MRPTGHRSSQRTGAVQPFAARGALRNLIRHPAGECGEAIATQARFSLSPAALREAIGAFWPRGASIPRDGPVPTSLARALGDAPQRRSKTALGELRARSAQAGTAPLARNPALLRSEPSAPPGSGRVPRGVTARSLSTRGQASRLWQTPLALQGGATDAKGISVCQSTRCSRERNWPTRRRAMG